MGINVEEFVGAEPEVSEVETVEQPVVEEPAKVDPPAEKEPGKAVAKEPAKEPEKAKQADVSKVADSFLADGTEEEEPDEQTVPVHVVRDLRQKNRDLKAQLQSLQTPTAADLAGVPAGIDIPDDELLTGAQVKTILPQIIAAHTAQIEERIETRIAARTMKATVAQSLSSARATHEDFDAVVGSARALGMLNDQDRTDSRLSQNPAEYLYLKAQQKINIARTIFGSAATTTPLTKPENKGSEPPVNPPASAQTEQERILSDDEYFDAQFGPPKKKELE